MPTTADADATLAVAHGLGSATVTAVLWTSTSPAGATSCWHTVTFVKLRGCWRKAILNVAEVGVSVSVPSFPPSRIGSTAIPEALKAV